MSYTLIREAIEQELLLAQRLETPRRADRKRRRKLLLCHAYYRLLEECVPVLQLYYDQPVYVINRFWHGLDLIGMISDNTYPGVNDFFDWFCSSDTIAREREQSW